MTYRLYSQTSTHHGHDTVGSRLSEPSIIQTPKVTVLLEYFSIGVCSIRVNDCSIRVFEQSLVYKSMGFSYPNKFTSLNTFA